MTSNEPGYIGALAAPTSNEVPEDDKLDTAEVAVVPEDEEDFVPSIFDQYETDQDAEENGKWFRDVRPGISLKLRRATSRKAMEARRRVIQRYRKLAKDGQFSKEIQDQILIHTMAEGVIVDWEGAAFRMPDNSPLPYSRKNAIYVLSKARGMRDEIVAIATDMDNFRVEAQEAVAGN